MVNKKKSSGSVKAKSPAKTKAAAKKPEKKVPEKKSKKTEPKVLTIPTLNIKKPEVKQEKVTKAKEKKAKAQAPVLSAPRLESIPGGKKRLIISYEKLPEEVIDVIRNKYPYGYNHDLKEVKGIDNKKFYVLPIETAEAVYLVKVDLRKPIKITAEVDEEEDMFTPEEDFGGEDEFPTEGLEQMEDEGDEEKPKKKKKKDEDDDDEGL